jgi:hypothetical protein
MFEELKPVIDLGASGIAILALGILFLFLKKGKILGTNGNGVNTRISNLEDKQIKLEANHLTHINARLDKQEEHISKICERLSAIETELKLTRE